MQRCNPHVIVYRVQLKYIGSKGGAFFAQNIYVDVVIRRLEDIIFFWERIGNIGTGWVGVPRFWSSQQYE